MQFTKYADISVMTPKEKAKLLSVLAEKVKTYRLAKGVTQQEAYDDTGIHFGRIEQGKRDVSYTTLVKLCEYLEMPLGEL